VCQIRYLAIMLRELCLLAIPMSAITPERTTGFSETRKNCILLRRISLTADVVFTALTGAFTCAQRVVAEELTVLANGPLQCERETPGRKIAPRVPDSSSLSPSKLLAASACYSGVPQMRFAGPWGNR
jgi:hypothetical protein